MLAALKYKQNVLDSFYLDDDDITIKRMNDDTKNGRFKKHDQVNSYTLRGEKGNDYRGIHVPGLKSGVSISLPWILTILRNIEFNDKNIIDHIDGNVTNNHRDNLRVTTQKVNCRNRTMRSDNTTGYTGLNFHKPSGRYAIRKTINGKRIWKSHKTLEGAIEIWEELKKLSLKDGYTERHGH